MRTDKRKKRKHESHTNTHAARETKAWARQFCLGPRTPRVSDWLTQTSAAARTRSLTAYLIHFDCSNTAAPSIVFPNTRMWNCLITVWTGSRCFGGALPSAIDCDFEVAKLGCTQIRQFQQCRQHGLPNKQSVTCFVCAKQKLNQKLISLTRLSEHYNIVYKCAGARAHISVCLSFLILYSWITKILHRYRNVLL